MTDLEVYDLLIKIDNGYEPNQDQVQEISTIEEIKWKWCSRLPKCMGMMRSLTNLDLSGNVFRESGLSNTGLSIALRRSKSLTDISVLSGLTALTSLDLSGRMSLTDISALSGLTALTILDLSDCRSLTDISALSGLTMLTNLKISGCRSLTDISALSGLTALTNLDLSGCRSLADISALSGLTALTNLNLSGCNNLVDISALSDLKALTHLDLSRCESLTDISALSGLTALTTLNLSGCRNLTDIRALSGLTALSKLGLSTTRVRNIGALSGLTALTKLYLSGCHFLMDISALSGLTALTTLYLSGCYFLMDISALSGLTALTELSLSGCRSLTDISVLSGMTALTNLDLSRCGSLTDISALSGLTALTNLDLSECWNLMNISALSELKNISLLNLRRSTISFLPESLLDLELDFIVDDIRNSRKAPGIYIYGLTLTDQPIELFSQSRDMIRAYYREQDRVPVNECKVVFLGDGGAGKTLMIDRLMNDGNISQNFNGESTPGICISSKEYDIGSDKIELHYWDFGGQAIMHSMHRLFLTNRTLYVVVANARDNKANEQAWYWIRNIKSFANGAPVLLVINQKDQNPSANVNVNGLRIEYPELKDVRMVSALKDSQAEFNAEIREVIFQIVAGMDTVHTPFSRSWISLMNNLQRMKEDYIDSGVFYSKCVESGINTELIDGLINWYQDLGVCFYSRQHPASRQYMVLKPKWLLNALYILIFNGRRYAVNGIIREADIYSLICEEVSEENIKKVWHDITYKTNEIQYIITVLLNFKLIYRINDEEFFIPMLCDENEPEYLQSFDSEDAKHVSFEYKYLPENVLHRLMVRHGYELDTKVVWKTGAVFKNELCGWKALIRMKDNCLDVYARADHQGTHPINSYLDSFRGSIYEINNDFGLSADEYIFYYRNGKKDRCKFTILEGCLRKGRNEIYSEVFDDYIDIDDIKGAIKSVDKLFGRSSSDQMPALLRSMMEALLKLQSNKTYYGASENDCNTYVRDLLETGVYICKDQTLQGVSASGKSHGEIDILIRDKGRGTDLSVFEALRLNSFSKSQKEYLYEHLKKLIDNYNPCGLTNLFLISYVSWDKEKFNELSNQYYGYVLSDEGAPYRIADSNMIDPFNGEFHRCLKIGYDCGNIVMYVYHIIVRVAS